MSTEKNTKLKQYLTSRKLTISDVVNLTKQQFEIGVGADRISNWLNGHRDITLSAVLKICAVLQCTPNEIIDFEEYLQ